MDRRNYTKNALITFQDYETSQVKESVNEKSKVS